MIPERAAAYALAVVCAFQAIHPSRRINAQGWRSIDIRIGRLSVQATNNADSACSGRLVEKKEEGFCSSKRSILLLHGGPTDLKILNICIRDSGCMTAWLDGSQMAGLSRKTDRED
jgi:hypothetical protein